MCLPYTHSLDGIRADEPFDYIAIGNGGTPRDSRGVPCVQRTDRRCLERVEHYPGPGRPYLITTRGTEVRFWSTLDELRELFGQIESPEEALWLVGSAAYYVKACEPGSVVTVPVGFEMNAMKQIKPCDEDSLLTATIGDVVLTVSPDGSFEERFLGTHEEDCLRPIPGRRPAAVMSAGAVALGSPLANQFARDARDEAASVAAFLQLAGELRRLSAPHDLVRGAQRAAREELAHARAMVALSARFGGRVQGPMLTLEPPRSLFAIALDNAVEGCVNETFAAFRAAYQARASGDPTVRRTLASIARDELGHAAWSWQLAAWAEPRLRASDRRAVGQVRSLALERLDAQVGVAPEPCMEQIAGVPDVAAARALLSALRGAVRALA